MAKITLKGNPINTVGNLPEFDSNAQDAKFTKTDLHDVSLKDYFGKKIVLNIFPSIDTPVCAASVRRFNVEAAKQENTVVLCISADLPFAHARFCGAEGLDKVVSLSTFRYRAFGDTYGIRIADGPLAGLLGRAVIIINEEGKVVYTELVPEIAQEPNYAEALKNL